MNFPSPEFQHVVQIILLCLGGGLLTAFMAFRPAPGSQARKMMAALLVVVSVASLASYTNWGKRHRYGTDGHYWYHYHDIYHYLIGAKYYPELGYGRLYECTWVAFQELEAEGMKMPAKIVQLRDLDEPDVFRKVAEYGDAWTEECHGAFSESRWASLKTDLKAWFVGHFWQDYFWITALGDMGFNPPPTWNVIGYTIAQVADPIERSTLQVLPFIDLFLVFVVGTGLVWRAFGPWAAAAYLLVLGTNWTATYRWTGGSYCRQLWFAFLVYGTCFLKMERWAWAGAALAASVCMRVFPALFVIGAVVAVARLSLTERRPRPFLELAGGGAGMTALLVAASLVLFGTDLWSDFVDKMGHHGNAYFTWHIGFKKYASFDPQITRAANYVTGQAPRLEEFSNYVQSFYDAHWLRNELVRGTLILTALGLAWRRPPAQATLVFGSVALFCLAMPANYYYVYLALLAVVFTTDEQGARPVLSLALVFAALVGVSISSWAYSDKMQLWQNLWINTTLFWFFVCMLLTLVVGEVQAWRSEGTSSTIE